MSDAERKEYMRAKNLIKIPIVMGETRKKLKETNQIEMTKMFCLVSLAVFVVSKTADFPQNKTMAPFFRHSVLRATSSLRVLSQDWLKFGWNLALGPTTKRELLPEMATFTPLFIPHSSLLEPKWLRLIPMDESRRRASSDSTAPKPDLLFFSPRVFVVLPRRC